MEILQQWVNESVQGQASIVPLAGDASLRRYFRAKHQDQSYIVMDARLAKQDNLETFIAIANGLCDSGLQAPVVHQADLELGFILLSDLGDTLLAHRLDHSTVGQLYSKAMDTLRLMQQSAILKNHPLPHYDQQLLNNEMQLFVDWFWTQHLQQPLTEAEQTTIKNSFELLIQEALAQPKVFVHRDYHSRNLMLLDNQEIGILDFQDAVLGPVTYDLVSLLKDCYIDWPQEKVSEWALSFKYQLEQEGMLTQVDDQVFLRWFDLMGLQRHLKCLGIFSRLNIRDQKPGYLQHLPRVLNYSKEVCERYDDLNPLGELLAKVKL